jgi:hypothetical protein
MPTLIKSLMALAGFSLTIAGNAAAQQLNPDPLRMTLSRLGNFAVHARVQVSQEAALERVDEKLLRSRIEQALRREGISVESETDVRDGSQASLDLLYMVMETKDRNGKAIGFAASSCLQASQIVRIPRLTTPKRIAYAVVPTWRSCGLLVGYTESFSTSILQNADEHIIRFIEAWRMVNARGRDGPEPRVRELLESASLRPAESRSP